MPQYEAMKYLFINDGVPYYVEIKEFYRLMKKVFGKEVWKRYEWTLIQAVERGDEIINGQYTFKTEPDSPN